MEIILGFAITFAVICLVTFLESHSQSKVWKIFLILSSLSFLIYFAWIYSTNKTYVDIDIHTTTLEIPTEKKITVQYYVKPDKRIFLLRDINDNNVILVDTSVTKMACYTGRKGSINSFSWFCNLEPK